MTARARRSAFTLLEVMVAVAILALALTAIFSSEAGAIQMAHRARKMGTATLLVRCKMGEIEEKVAMKGLPALYDSGSDTCCEAAPIDGYTCDWEVDPIILPDNMFAPQGQPGSTTNPNAKNPDGTPIANGTSSTGTSPNGLGTTGSNMPGVNSSTNALGTTPGGLGTTPGTFGGSTPGAMPGTMPDMTGAMPGGMPGAMPGMPGATPGMPGATPGATGSGPLDKLASYRNVDPATLLAGGGLGGLASMALAFVYPILKPAFESQIRRATVTVHWKEGRLDHKFDVTQYLVADQPVPLTPDMLQQAGQGVPGQTQPGVAPSGGVGLGLGTTPGLQGQP